MSWVKAIGSDELRKKKQAVFRHGSRQIALFQLGGKVYATDNRCPHEGYPLAEGHTADNCTLTCNWHNWKFDLNTGTCLVGADNVRTYEVKTENGAVLVNVTEPPKEEIAAAVIKGLKTGFDKLQSARMGRELARLYYNGIDPLQVIPQAVEWAHDRMEFGETHAIAVIADWLHLYDSREAVEDKLICLNEILYHLSYDSERQPQFPYPQGAQPFSHDAMLQAVEAEDHERAHSLLNGALAAGASYDALHRTFAHAALAHYDSFGHSTIYVERNRELLERFPQLQRAVLHAALREMLYATREDLIPEFADYAPALRELRWGAALSNTPPAAAGLDGRGVKAALQWTVDAARSHAPLAIHQTLLESCAKQFLYFDPRYMTRADVKAADSVNWLDFSHAITFGGAVRRICARYPELWPAGLLQMACFRGRNAGYTDERRDVSEFFVTDTGAFFADCEARLLDHGQSEPIYAAHYVKNYFAHREELRHAGESCRRVLLASLNRFFHGAFKYRHARRIIKQGLELVAKDFQ